ncbi:MAG: DUF1569 domain-containing protein [Bacteroidota bacterium]
MDIQKQIQELKALSVFIGEVNPNVSKASVGWHITHSLIVIKAICKQLKSSDPKKCKPKFSFPKFLVVDLGYFPRGRAESPKFVLPKEVITNEYIERQTHRVEELLPQIQNLDANNYIDHPMMGHIEYKRAKRFMSIHTNHHLKIIKDILKANGIEK